MDRRARLLVNDYEIATDPALPEVARSPLPIRAGSTALSLTESRATVVGTSDYVNRRMHELPFPATAVRGRCIRCSAVGDRPFRPEKTERAAV